MADQVNYLKTKKQKEYDITKVSLKTFNNGTEMRMIIALERFSGTYILSVFIPTFCLIVAAEITLFIDSNHFEASIMVALTTNLVTYTIYGKCNIRVHISGVTKFLTLSKSPHFDSVKKFVTHFVTPEIWILICS